MAIDLAGRRDEFMEPGDPRRRTPPSPDRLLIPLDVNGDGVMDWRVNYENAEWPGGWCGSGGCRQQIWVSAPGGRHTLAYDDTAYRLAMRVERGARYMDAGVHGTACGGAGAVRCTRTYVWDARQRRLRLIRTSRPQR